MVKLYNQIKRVFFCVNFILFATFCNAQITGYNIGNYSGKKTSNEVKTATTNGTLDPAILQACYNKLKLGKNSARPSVVLLSHSIGAGFSASTIDSSWFSIFRRDMQALDGNVLEEDNWYDFSDPSFRGISYSGPPNSFGIGYYGPAVKSLTMTNGFQMDFDGSYDYIDFWTSNSTIGSEIELYKDGVLYRTLTISTTDDKCTYDGTTTNNDGKLHHYTIKMISEGQFTITGMKRSLIKDYSNNKRPFNFDRQAIPGWNTSIFIQNLPEIGKVLSDDLNQKGIYIIDLEGNEWGLDPTVYASNLDTIVKQILKKGHIPFLSFIARPFPPDFTGIIPGTCTPTQYVNLEAAAHRVADQNGIGFASALNDDFYGKGYLQSTNTTPGGLGNVHFNNAGHVEFAKLIEQGIINSLSMPLPRVDSVFPSSGYVGTEVIIKGNFFTDVTGVSFGGVPAKSFKVISFDTIKATIDTGSSGNIIITTARGNATFLGFIFQKKVSFCASVGSVQLVEKKGLSNQWQIDTGRGFINVVDNTNFNGSQTGTLTVMNIPYAWNNAQLRCLINNTSNTSTVYVVSLTSAASPNVVLSASETITCKGQNVTFTTMPINGGVAPNYQWMVNGTDIGIHTNVFSVDSLRNGDNIQVKLISGATCALSSVAVSNPIALVVYDTTPPKITITGNLSDLGLPSVITAAVITTDPTIVLQWQDSIITHNWQAITGANLQTITYNPAHAGDKLRAVLTTTNRCITPNTITSNVLTVTQSGVSQQITYYPNPVTSKLTLDKLYLNDHWQKVTVTSITGKQDVISQTITGQTQVAINTQSLVSGIYIATIVNDTGKIIRFKFIKE